jgi:toxin ParE1/3/4
MKIYWSPLAVERLNEIYEYITTENIFAAQNFIENLLNKVETLVSNSERGRKVPESNRNDIREIFEGEYRIVYRLESKNIFILTIRNFKQLLPDEDLE